MILLVEDNMDDVLFMKRAVANSGIRQPLNVASNGDTAIEWLGGEGEYADRKEYPFPSLVFLDLKMPGTSGFDVLSWIRSQDRLKALLVLILSTSREDRDVSQAYRLGANSFLVKPGDIGGLNDLMGRVKNYWLENPQLAVSKEGFVVSSS